MKFGVCFMLDRIIKKLHLHVFLFSKWIVKGKNGYIWMLKAKQLLISKNNLKHLRYLYFKHLIVFSFFFQRYFLCHKIWRCPTDPCHTWPRWPFYKWARSGPRTDRTDTDGVQPFYPASSLLDNTGRTCRSRSCVSGIRRHLQFSHLHRHLEKFCIRF